MEKSESSKESKIIRMKNEKLHLDHYVDFFCSRNQLTVHLLNQIIKLHGFRRIGAPKKILSDALDTLDLIDPCRSTLKEDVNPCALMSLEDVVADLNDLNWRDCSVTCIQTLNTGKGSLFSSSSSASQVSSLQCSDFSMPKPKSKTGKQGRKRKRNTVQARGGDGDSSSPLPSAVASFGSC